MFEGEEDEVEDEVFDWKLVEGQWKLLQ